VLLQGIPFGGFGHIGGIAISSEIATTLVETVVYCLETTTTTTLIWNC